MGWLFFLGGAVVVAVVVLVLVVKVRRWMRRTLGTASISEFARKAEMEEESTPKSLSGGDAIYLPMILRDFPDFNVETAKTQARERLTAFLEGKDGVRIHRVTVSNYRSMPHEKVVFFQASAEYRAEGKRTQHKYQLQYASLMADTDGPELGLNCPNCGAPVTDANIAVCPYCGCRLLNITGNAWRFTEIIELQ